MMPADEHDQPFERALERQLRSASPDAACPEAETLAAYYERTLSLEEMARWKDHIAGCARCQETLKLLEETGALVLNEWEENHAVAGAGPEETRSVPAGFAVPASEPGTAVTSRAAMTAISAASPGPGGIKRHSRSRWKWIVPAGALAAGLLIFVSLREGQEHRATAPLSAPAEVAENRAPGPPPALQQQTTPSEAQKSSRENPFSRAPERLDALSRKQDEAKYDSALAPAVRTKPAPDDQLATLKAELEAQGRPAPPMLPMPTAPRPTSGPAVPTRPRTYASGGFDVANRAASPMAKARAVPNSSTNAASADTAGALVAGDSATSLAVEARDYVPIAERIASDRSYIADPSGKALWRVGAAGKIEFSVDNAKSWTLQNSGTKSDLTTGVSVSDKVCWIVGKAGALLVTTDGGAHWKQVVAPVAQDLASVTATDAEHATVRTAPGHPGFTTRDGGLTWTPAP